MQEKYLTYDEVALVPSFSSAITRSMCSTTSTLRRGKVPYKVPVIPSNMKCTISQDTSYILQSNNYFYVMHRFGDTYSFTRTANDHEWSTISISVGVKKEDYELLKIIKKDNLHVDSITIDIAHGHSHSMIEMIKFIKDTLPNAYLIAGNVATPESFLHLSKVGADAIKVGIGQGAACTTKLQTGFTLPMFTCIQKISDTRKDTGINSIIIADGGIKYNGDIAKALVAGADWVMSGKLFAECIDSPAPIINNKKSYYGSASFNNKGHHHHVEGTCIEVESSSNTYLSKLKEIEQDLQSSISYAGGSSIDDLKKCKWVRV